MHLCKHLQAFIDEIFNKADAELEQLLPVATGVVQAFKTLDDSVGDPIAALIGGLAPAIQTQIKALLPKVLLEMKMIAAVEQAATEDQINTALKALLDQVKISSDADRQKAYTTLAAMIIQQLHSSKLTFAQAVIDVEYFYQHFVVSTK